MRALIVTLAVALVMAARYTPMPPALQRHLVASTGADAVRRLARVVARASDASVADVHSARVAVRKARATLRWLVAPTPNATLTGALRAAHQALGIARDIDVLRSAEGADVAGCEAERRMALDHWAANASCVIRRLETLLRWHISLAPLRPRRLELIRDAFAAMGGPANATSARPRARGDADDVVAGGTAGEFARYAKAALRRGMRSWKRRAVAAAGHTSLHSLHELRVASKSLRYVCGALVASAGFDTSRTAREASVTTGASLPAPPGALLSVEAVTTLQRLLVAMERLQTVLGDHRDAALLPAALARMKRGGPCVVGCSAGAGGGSVLRVDADQSGETLEGAWSEHDVVPIAPEVARAAEIVGEVRQRLWPQVRAALAADAVAAQ